MFSKEVYIDEIKKQKSNDIYIYGAGKVAQIIYEICRNNGVMVSAFCVTDKKENLDYIENTPVIQFNNNNINKKALILIGVLEHKEKKLRNYITQFGEYNIIDLPDGILYTDNFCHKKKINPAMEITPLVGCSVNCKYCPQSTFLSAYYKNDKNRKRAMSFEDFKICLDKIPKNTLIEWAGFVEPFLNDKSIDMMEYANENGYNMTLFTTLVGLSDEQLERVLNIPFKQVVLHTADKDGYANIPVNDNYIKKLKKIVNATKSDGSAFIDSANCQSVPHSVVTEIAKGKLKIYCELSDRAGNLDNAENKLKGGYNNGRICCERADNLDHNVLLPDGTVVLCCNDFGMEHVLGNLLNQDYCQILKSESMRQIKRGMNLDESIPILCRKCMYAKKVKRF